MTTDLRRSEYPHPCRWCPHQAPTHGALVRHVEGEHPVEHWDWLGQRVMRDLSQMPEEA